jgi:hypothetical protein
MNASNPRNVLAISIAIYFGVLTLARIFAYNPYLLVLLEASGWIYVLIAAMRIISVLALAIVGLLFPPPHNHYSRAILTRTDPFDGALGSFWFGMSPMLLICCGLLTQAAGVSLLIMLTWALFNIFGYVARKLTPRW